MDKGHTQIYEYKQIHTYPKKRYNSHTLTQNEMYTYQDTHKYIHTYIYYPRKDTQVNTSDQAWTHTIA